MEKEIKEILNDFETIREILYKKRKTHYIDLNHTEWNDEIDGLDYAIHRLRELLRTQN